MGQKEIFMVLLVLIIVVLSIVIAMLVLKTENVVLSENELEEVMLEAGVNFRAWYSKPTGLGGGGKDWSKADFGQVPCTLGSSVSTNANAGCMTEDRRLMMMLAKDTDHIRIHGLAHIGGSDAAHIYSRTLRVYPDSVAWEDEWKHY